MQTRDGSSDYRQLVKDEIGNIVIVRLSVKKGSGVFRRCSTQDAGDRYVLAEPIALLKHRPVEERSRCSTVPIDERVIVGEPKVENDRPKHGMNESAAGLGVREGAHLLQSLG